MKTRARIIFCLVSLLVLISGIATVYAQSGDGNIDRSKLTYKLTVPQVACDNCSEGVVLPATPDDATSTPTQSGATNTPKPTQTPGGPTATATNTSTVTPTPTRTNTPAPPTATNTPPPGSTNTPTPTNTPVTPTATNTPVTPSPTATNTPVNNAPVLQAVSPDETTGAQSQFFQLTGQKFTADSTVEIRNATAGGVFTQVSPSEVTYNNPNSIVLEDFAFPSVTTTSTFQVRVVNSEGASNAVNVTVSPPPNTCPLPAGTFNSVGESNSSAVNFTAATMSTFGPCTGQNVSIQVRVSDATPASSVTVMFAWGSGCSAPIEMTEISPGIWEAANLTYTGPTSTSNFGYRFDGTSAGGSSRAKITTTPGGAPFATCE